MGISDSCTSHKDPCYFPLHHHCTELETQTTVLRAQLDRGRDPAALAEYQARLHDRESQIQQLQEQQTKLQELSQVRHMINL